MRVSTADMETFRRREVFEMARNLRMPPGGLVFVVPPYGPLGMGLIRALKGVCPQDRALPAAQWAR